MEQSGGAGDERARWDRRWASEPAPAAPAAFVVAAEAHFPAVGTALDVAGGSGRHAVWLARKGWDVTLVDISAVALEKAAAAAVRSEVAVATLRRDLAAAGLPAGTWDLIVDHHYLDRGVLAAVPEALRPGGAFVFCQPTVRNLEAHPRPGRRYLLAEGELGNLVAALDLEVVLLEEGWGVEGRHEARLIARRAP